ncbi:MAG: hypothetical protein ACE5FL_02940 [Myxococcota bacterium]
MSALGEFRRLIGACTDLLEASDVPATEAWADALASTRAVAPDDLTGAAAHVLVLARRTPSFTDAVFQTHEQAVEFRERCDHMLALARVLVGEPAKEDGR